jgi:hypothetical protein
LEEERNSIVELNADGAQSKVFLDPRLGGLLEERNFGLIMTNRSLP